MTGSLRWVKFFISYIQYIVVLTHNQNYTCYVHLALPLPTKSMMVTYLNYLIIAIWHLLYQIFAVSDILVCTCHFKEFSLCFRHKETCLGFGTRFVIKYIIESQEVFVSYFCVSWWTFCSALENCQTTLTSPCLLVLLHHRTFCNTLQVDMRQVDMRQWHDIQIDTTHKYTWYTTKYHMELNMTQN